MRRHGSLQMSNNFVNHFQDHIQGKGLKSTFGSFHLKSFRSSFKPGLDIPDFLEIIIGFFLVIWRKKKNWTAKGKIWTAKG